VITSKCKVVVLTMLYTHSRPLRTERVISALRSTSVQGKPYDRKTPTQASWEENPGLHLASTDCLSLALRGLSLTLSNCNDDLFMYLPDGPKIRCTPPKYGSIMLFDKDEIFICFILYDKLSVRVPRIHSSLYIFPNSLVVV